MKYGRGAKKSRRRAWVFGMIERTTKRLFLYVCPRDGEGKYKRTRRALIPMMPTLSQGPFCIRTAGGHIDDWMNTVTNIIGWTTICTTVTQVILPSIPIWSKAFGLRSKGGYLGQEATTSPNTLTSFNGFISRNCSWDLEIWHRVAIPKCCIWELLHLRIAPFEKCSIW